MRHSLTPTFDSRKTGEGYRIDTRVNKRLVSSTPLSDPFVSHRVTIGWVDVLRSLLRRKIVVDIQLTTLDSELVEDVCELDANYAGRHDSTRRKEWREEIEKALQAVRP